jgi:hypothetical protein
MGPNRLSGIAAAFLLFLANLLPAGCVKTAGVTDDVLFSYQSDPAPARLGVNAFTVTPSRGAGALEPVRY